MRLFRSLCPHYFSIYFKFSISNELFLDEILVSWPRNQPLEALPGILRGKKIDPIHFITFRLSLLVVFFLLSLGTDYMEMSGLGPVYVVQGFHRAFAFWQSNLLCRIWDCHLNRLRLMISYLISHYVEGTPNCLYPSNSYGTLNSKSNQTIDRPSAVKS